MRKKSTPRRYTNDLFHPASYRQRSEETMVSPFRWKRKTKHAGLYPRNVGSVDDLVRQRKYQNIIDAAQYNVLVRGGLRKYEKPFFRSLMVQYPMRLTRSMQPARQRRYQRGKFILNKFKRIYPWRFTGPTVDQDAGYDDWAGVYVP